MNPENDNWDEERLEALFTAADSNPVPPDEAFLDRLRERSTEEFAAASAPTRPAQRRPRMFAIAFRTLTAAAAIVAAASLWFFSSTDDSSVALGNVLEKLADAETLHLEITRQGKAEKIWVKRAQQLRWNHADGTYKIARGKRMWLVDEQANRATSQAADYFRGDRAGFDLLALLDLPALKDRTRLLQERPAEQIRRDGVRLLVYRMDVPSPQGEIHIEAAADAATRGLQWLKADRRQNGTTRPIAALKVRSVNEPLDEELFVVGDTLTEDGRIGKVTDRQGIVSVKPLMHQRWTPLVSRMLVRPGDWLRTDVRGANAVAVRLVGQTDVTLGPGSLVELLGPRRIRLTHGELKVTAPAKTPLELIGPGEKKLAVKGTQIYRLDKEKLVRLDKEPLWLRGFEGSTTNESIGSLVAKVEGRNEPLTVGYHKVSVDIRDQIARTVIEESFVNHTKTRLEGVFYFPLPPRASISGFGMWIGNELVEADVVEKQRAREIYETILRERRDPGLLEWAGGNMFKARVFPIEALSEKRIKITYTQVLPLRGNQYRYSYALQSEMLKQYPLRELAIDVKLTSVVPITSVKSPTHTTRNDRTKHSAHVEFNAQEYTPTRDFEVVVEVDGRQSDTVLIPHRRGDDGYFMLQLTPPAGENGESREILPDGEPLDLLILADTSASIDASSRNTQAEFIATVLGALTAKDKFNLAACDVDCRWSFPKAVTANDENIKAARQFLADQISLGWTDLDRTFASTMKQSGPKTQVIYIGDGIVTGQDCDPVAFGKRLKRLYEGHPGTLHAVSIGSSFEPVVMKTVGSLHGGSVRQISGEQGPQAVALELLGEITRPAVRDLKVEFRGLQTARVYPERLPNLPAGSQQILLGRYLPEGKDQTGEVIVTATQAGKPIRMTAQVSLRDAESGNSFIPRLWARMHLDTLLQQGAASVIRDEIIALSEEYHIITPYTSLLVLESDADRERFKVKRRFQMRDGEKFFAEGRDQADYELIQQQMKRAGTWRQGLRRAVLAQLMALGRDPNVFTPQQDQTMGRTYNRLRGGMGGGMMGGKLGGMQTKGYLFGDLDSAGVRMRMNGLGFDGKYNWSVNGRLGGEHYLGLPVSISGTRGGERRWRTKESRGFELSGLDFDGEDLGAITMSGDALEWSGELNEELEFAAKMPVANRESFGLARVSELADSLEISGPALSPGRYDLGNRQSRKRTLSESLLERRRERYYFSPVDHERHRRDQYTQWLGTLFPHLPPPPSEEKPEEPMPPWPAEARALAKSLLRSEQLATLEGGLRIERRADYFDVRWGDLTSRSETLALVAPQSWLIRSGGHGSQTLVQWCDAKQRSVLSKAFQLGRQRASTPPDLRQPPLGLSGHVLTSLEHTFRNYSAEVRPQGEQRSLLVLTGISNPRQTTHILIDTPRSVILSLESRHDDKVTSKTVFDQFVNAAGAWWAGRIEKTDAEGRRTRLITQEFKPLSAEALQQQVAGQLAGRERVQFLQEPLVKVIDAKRALAAGKVTFDDQLAMVLHFAGTQQWQRVLEHLGQAEKLAPGKPGLRWVRDAVLNISRRREELKGRIMAEAGRIAKPQADGGVDSEEMALAEYLRGQAAGIFQAGEMLVLSDALKPIFQRQPPHLKAMKRWKQQRVSYLQQTGQSGQALQLQKELAAEYPHDRNMQRQYAQGLAGAGEYAAAYAWLDQVLTEQSRWLPHEADSLRNVYADLLRSQGRYLELVEYLQKWIEQNPETGTAYQQYLSALIRTEQVEKADELVAQWIREGRLEGPLPPDVAARLSAAVSLALGQGHNLHNNRIDERWLEPLAETVLFFARHEHEIGRASQIMNLRQFNQSDQCRRVRKTIAGILSAEIDTLRIEQIRPFIAWVMPDDPAVEKETWKRIAAGLQRRWAAEKDPKRKHELAGPLVQVLSSRIGAEEHLAFLRRQLSEGPKEHRSHYARQLFDALLTRPWSAEHEAEAFTLLGQLSDAKKPAERLLTQVAAVHQLTDRMVAARFQARMAKIEHQERLTRTELREKQRENLKIAREGFAGQLSQQMPKHPEELVRWINVERLYLDTQLGRSLDRVAAECWEYLGPVPRKLTAEPGPQRLLEEVLRERFLITLMNLAVRKNAEPGLDGRLLKYIDRAIELDGKDPRWKLLKYQLLIALDRPKELQTAMRAWVRADEPDGYWRLSLGYLLAEQAKFDEAIKQFEAVETTDELGPTQYRALADWYLVVDRREDHERALISVHKTTDEWQMANWLSQKLQPWQRGEGELPAELDKNVLRVFAALLDKSAHPQNHLDALSRFYRATRDFRLLEALADAVAGHTAGKIYPFLQGMQSVLAEVRDEATADSIVARLAEVRSRAKTDVDHRALDLLELLVERRAAELLNQPGPHAEKALAAVQRAFKRSWSSGEPRLMANFLAGLGAISQESLAQEQLRQLEVLHAEAARGMIDRLHIAHQLAVAHWNYNRRDQAIDLLEAALAEYQAASSGILPVDANGPLDALVSYLEQHGHHARGENVLFEQLEHPVHRQQTLWLTQRLYQLYEHALRHGGDVSVGSGQTLYTAVNGKIQAELPTADQNHRRTLIERLCSIYRTAKEKKLAVADDFRAFAFQRLPEVLTGQINSYDSIVSTVAETLHDVVGPRDGLAFLIERIEHEPAWFRYTNRDSWSQHAWRLSYWREQVKQLGDLEGRLLAIVLRELRRDLESRQHRNRVMYYRDHSRYWKEKENDFVATAEDVYAKRKGSPAAVKYLAEYFYHGVYRHARAIEILFVAHHQGLLDEGGQSRLVEFLHWQNRHGESIAVLQPLVERRADNMQYRVWLMHAYFRTNRPDELLVLLKQTDEHFHQPGRWTEDAMAKLAHSCLENHLFQQSVEYYGELIPLHQRTQPRRGIGGGTLSTYYGNLARAHAGLKETAQAVDAACGAIVSWGPKHDERQQAHEALKQVLREAADLDGYVAELDKQVAESGQDSPIVRKALGQIYVEKQQYAKAKAQLQLAAELQPNDRETHDALIACFDQLEDPQGAVRQMLALAELSRRDVELYKKLGERFHGLGEEAQTERAYTSTVEMLPSESESHTMLAEIRQRQDRWDDAIAHWRQVAQIRALEPTGLLRLAEAQIHQRQWDRAGETLRKLDTKGWPERFGNVHAKVRQFERQIESNRHEQPPTSGS